MKCTECNMTLNMKNYKGYNKMPYCNAHYPQLKATVVADTPEMKRYDQVSKQQSQVEYHREYEASRGQVTSDADASSYTRPMRSANDDNDDGYRPPYNPMAGQMPMGCMPVPEDVGPPPPQNQPTRTGALYRALYDYDAADEDEVSFVEEDTITNVQQVDDGWVIGVVERTGDKSVRLLISGSWGRCLFPCGWL